MIPVKRLHEGRIRAFLVGCREWYNSEKSPRIKFGGSHIVFFRKAGLGLNGFLRRLTEQASRGFPLFEDARKGDGEHDHGEDRPGDVCRGLGVKRRLHAPERGEQKGTAQIHRHFARERYDDGVVRIAERREPVYKRIGQGEGDGADHEHADAPNALFGHFRRGGEQRHERPRAQKRYGRHERGKGEAEG